jgi:hypothetical protein
MIRRIFILRALAHSRARLPADVGTATITAAAANPPCLTFPQARDPGLARCDLSGGCPFGLDRER